METHEPKTERLPWVQDIQRRCQVMAELTREREATEIVHLPAWPDNKRGTPNSFIRSALFAAIQSKDRVFIKDQVLASQQGVIVKFTGEQLNQEDLTVWEALVHLAKQHPLGHTCRFSGHSILSLIDLPKSADHYKTLQNSIERLAACLVKIENHRHVYGGSLVHRFMIDKTLLGRSVLLEGPSVGRIRSYRLNPEYGYKVKVTNLQKELKNRGLTVINGGA